MKPKILLVILQWTFALVLCFYISSLLFNVYMNTLWDKTPEETRLPEHSFNHTLRQLATIYKEDGFKIPVTLSFFYPDTIVQYAGQLNQETKEKESWIYSSNNVDNRNWQSSWNVSLGKFDAEYRPRYDTLYQVDTLVTRALTEKTRVKKDGFWLGSKELEDEDAKDVYWVGEKIEERFENNIFDLAAFQPHVKSWVSVKPKEDKHYLIMLLRSNLPTLFFIFLFYQLLKTAKVLRSNFKVSKQLYFNMKIIGFALLGYTLLQYFLDLRLKSIYDFISIQSNSSSINHIESLSLYMYGYAGFNFHVFCGGLFLIILSGLMKRSSKIEDSWSLVI